MIILKQYLILKFTVFRRCVRIAVIYGTALETELLKRISVISGGITPFPLEIPMSSESFPTTERRNYRKLGALATAIALGAFSDLGGGASALAIAGAESSPVPSDNPFATTGEAPTEVRAVHTKRKLKVETVNPDNFAPFGWVMTPEKRIRQSRNAYGDRLDLYCDAFARDQPTEWFLLDGQNRGTRVLFLERHQHLSQTFIPVGGKGFYMVVAPATCREENGFPALDELRAFFVPGDSVIHLHSGTWHENPMPKEDGTRLLVTSHAADPQNLDMPLKGLPLDVERRWFKHGGYDLALAI